MLVSMLAASAFCMVALPHLQPGRTQPRRLVGRGVHEADRGSLKSVTVLWQYLVNWSLVWRGRGQLLVQSPKVVRAVAGNASQIDTCILARF